MHECLSGICSKDDGRNRTSCRFSNAVWEFPVWIVGEMGHHVGALMLFECLLYFCLHRRLRRPEHEADHASTKVAAEFIGVA